MVTTTDGQIHHRLDGGVEQFQHEHGRDRERQHSHADQIQLQHNRQAEDHRTDDDVNAEVALAREGITKPLCGVTKAGR